MSVEGHPIDGGGSAMNDSLEHHRADNRHAARSGAAPPGESIWRIRARNANLHFDHTILAELIARDWKQDRPYFALVNDIEHGQRATSS